MTILQPLAVQRLDRRVVAEGEDRVAVLPAAAGAVPDRPEVELGVDRGDDLLAADVVVEDGGVRGAAAADLGQRPEQPGARRGDLLGADREGDLGMVLVGGAGEEVGGRRGEGQQHQQEEAGERPPVPRPGAGPAAGAGAMAAASARAAAAPAPAPRRSPSASVAPRRARPRRARPAGGRRPRRSAAGRRRRRGRRRGGRGRGCGRSSRGGVIGPLIGPLGARPAPGPRAAAPARKPGLVIAAPPGLPLAPDESKPRRGAGTRATARCRRRRSRRRPRGDPAGRSGPAGRGSSGCG